MYLSHFLIIIRSFFFTFKQIENSNETFMFFNLFLTTYDFEENAHSGGFGRILVKTIKVAKLFFTQMYLRRGQTYQAVVQNLVTHGSWTGERSISSLEINISFHPRILGPVRYIQKLL